MMTDAHRIESWTCDHSGVSAGPVNIQHISPGPIVLQYHKVCFRRLRPSPGLYHCALELEKTDIHAGEMHTAENRLEIDQAWL